MTIKLDHYDRALLNAVQEDASVPQSVLGERVSLSTAAVNRRLRMLSDSGVIERYAACVDPSAVGYPLTIVAEVKVESERADLLQDVRTTFLECQEIQQCYYVAGECDFVLIFLVKDMEQYIELTRTLFHQNNNIKSFKTMVAMDRVKAGLAIPI